MPGFNIHKRETQLLAKLIALIDTHHLQPYLTAEDLAALEALKKRLNDPRFIARSQSRDNRREKCSSPSS